MSEKIDFSERAKYVPLRLSLKERKMLRIVRASIKVNDYTNKIDKENLNLNKKNHLQISEICSVLSSISLCVDYETGQKVIKKKIFNKYNKFFKSIFEVGRRHKGGKKKKQLFYF